MSRFVFVAAIFDLASESTLDEGVQLGTGLRLISEPERVSVLKRKQVGDWLGSLEVRHLQRAPLMVTGEVDGPESFEDTQRLAYLLARHVDNCLFHLWLMRDCSPVVDQCYLIGRDSVHANRTVYSTTMADGVRRNTVFSTQELQGLRPVASLLDRERSTETRSDSPDWWRTRETLSDRDSSRWTRFLGLIAVARQADDLALKVAHYCSALEAILSTGTGELRHLLSERVALLVPSHNRLETYKAVQQIYDQRSRVLHGSMVDRKVDLRALAVTADGLARMVAGVFIERDEFRRAVLDDMTLRDYFLLQLLGVHKTVAACSGQGGV